MEHNQDGAFFWWRAEPANALPPAIVALKPMDLSYNSPKILRNFPGETQVPVVHIRIFGLHATGGRATPYFGFDVVAGTNGQAYEPTPSTGASGNCHNAYRKITDKIYEVF